ncbi:MAG: undecaprenyldiphospho-muramoylpentapeptide beta-N-acetylglucosaminyltransferase [Actinobacteria bacterium]|nr:undecaprenyldiphospho-muramoylpentapeptide beta-N-acetylglucosaminyltransferase [Actinomycetota bacterium]
MVPIRGGYVELRIVVTGGGTGGHVYAAVSMALSCKKRLGSEVLYIGSKSGPEARIARDAGIDFEGADLSGVAGGSIFAKARSLLLFIHGLRWCRKLLRDFKPDCVIGTGGYVSAPACFAAVTRKVPLVLSEMNFNPGIVTRVLAGRAYAVALAYEETGTMLKSKANTVLTGIPVRKDIEDLRDGKERMKIKSEALREFGLRERRRTLLVFGGSQGAKAINTAVRESLPGLMNRDDLQILHITGKRDNLDEGVSMFPENIDGGELVYKVVPYTEKMNMAYAVCDLAITRGGAGTLAELTVAGVPSVIVPYPYAAEDHQSRNAEALVGAGAAVLVRQSGDNASEAVIEAVKLIDKPMRLRDMSLKCGDVYLGNGSNGIIEILNGLSGTGSKAGKKSE